MVLDRYGALVGVAAVVCGVSLTVTLVPAAAFGSTCCSNAAAYGWDTPESCARYWSAFAMVSMLPGVSAIAFTVWASILRHIPCGRLVVAVRHMLAAGRRERPMSRPPGD